MCMTSMMIAMAVGMLNGLLSGVILGIVVSGNIFLSTVLGMCIGFLTGSLIGLTHGLKPVLDGMLAGLMGGMMGAMLGGMVPIHYQELIVKIIFAFSVIILLLTVNLLHDEIDEVSTYFTKIIQSPMVTAILLIGFFYMYENIGPIFIDESSQINLKIDHDQHE